MLNAIIRFSLQNRLLIVAASAFLVVYGGYVIVQLPVDVLPDINRPGGDHHDRVPRSGA